jgi:F-type H+-transporting ATPase subunit b
LRDSNKQTRFFAPLFRFALLALLTASTAFLPCRLTAQDPAPAANQSGQATDAAKPEAPKSQEEQNNTFRLTGPIVKATAKALNMSVERVALFYDLFNLAIIALAIGIPLFRYLPKYLRNRGQKLSEDIESARKTAEDANARLSAVEAKLSSIGEEIEKFRAEVEHESVADEARIKASLKEESERIVAAAEQEIAAAAAQARRGLRTFAADLAVGQAAKQIVLTPETDRALIAEFVGDVTGKGKS